MAFLLNDVLRDPSAVAEHINTDQVLLHLTVSDHSRTHAVFHGVFRPPAAFAEQGYQVEQARIVVAKKQAPQAFPIGPARAWQHRNGPFGDLCLWFDGDPRGLRWGWEDGFEAYIAIVHRHLFFEQVWRRTGSWPVEEAPHGPGDHPIKTAEMLWKAKMWNS